MDIDPSALDLIAYDVGWFEQSFLVDELKEHDLYTVEAIRATLKTVRRRQQMWNTMVEGLVAQLVLIEGASMLGWDDDDELSEIARLVGE